MGALNQASHRRLSTTQQLALWAGVVVPAGVWSLQFAAGYALVPWLCESERTTSSLALLSLVALVATAGGLAAAWSTWRRHRPQPGDDDLLAACCRFMGLLGLLLGALFFVAIVAQALPAFVVHSCT